MKAMKPRFVGYKALNWNNLTYPLHYQENSLFVRVNKVFSLVLILQP